MPSRRRAKLLLFGLFGVLALAFFLLWPGPPPQIQGLSKEDSAEVYKAIRKFRWASARMPRKWTWLAVRFAPGRAWHAYRRKFGTPTYQNGQVTLPIPEDSIIAVFSKHQQHWSFEYYESFGHAEHQGVFQYRPLKASPP
jgi:hypothetical protein